MTSKADLVHEHFPLNFNCAQTVFSLFATEPGIEESIALKIASGFGGGMAYAETCGAVTGFDISGPEGSDVARNAGVFMKLCPKFIKTACDLLENEF